MITLLSTPDKFMAAHNFIPYTISSDKTAEPNFNFVIDVYDVAGVFGSPLARLTYPVQPGTNELTFDVGVVLKNYVSYDFNNVTSSILAANTNSRVHYYCVFYELYDVSGIPTLNGPLASDPAAPSSSEFKVAANSIFDFEDYGPLAYANCDVSGFGYLNADLPYSESITTAQHRILSFLDGGRVATQVSLQIGGDEFTYDLDPLPENEYLFNINAGKYLLDQSMLPLGFDEYTVRILDPLGLAIATKTFSLIEECTIYDNVRLHWLNKLGAFEAFNFNKVSRHNEDISRKQFKAPLQIGYATSDRLKTNYNTTITDKITVNSDWITDQQSEYFEQLITSPAIFLERSATDFVAVNITNVEYEQKKFINDRKMFNITFDIEYSYNRYRQTL